MSTNAFKQKGGIMKTITNVLVNHYVLVLALAAALVCSCSCSRSKPTPDPLAGFHPDVFFTPDTNKAITDDYKDYIQKQKLSPEKGEYVAYIEYFSDGTGQHAVRIAISMGKTDWEHVLIYDKDDKRIATIKYISGHSSS